MSIVYTVPGFKPTTLPLDQGSRIWFLKNKYELGAIFESFLN